MENEEQVVEKVAVKKTNKVIAKAKEVGSTLGQLAWGALLLGGFYTAVYAVTQIGSKLVDSALDNFSGNGSSGQDENVVDVSESPIE